MATYIIGHKNPDTDTVCSSIALSYLKNACGEKTIPKVLGNLNNETKFVLNYFNVCEPSYLNDVRVRIKNVKYNKKVLINENKSIDKAYKLMQKENVTAIPLVDDNKKLCGYVTLKELVNYLINDEKNKLDTTLDNIVELLNAKVIIKTSDFIKGIIKCPSLENDKKIKDNSVVILDDNTKDLDLAISLQAKLIIVPIGLNIGKRLIKKAEDNGVNVLATELTTLEVFKILPLSNYIKNINENNKPVTINNEDCYFDFKAMPHKVNHTNYPVVNKKGECLGLIRLTGPNDYEKQKLILVDHNNFNQSVDGIEEAEILEIIDHHNLGAIDTRLPINFHSKPVGSTATMIYEMFIEKHVPIPKDIAGLLLSAVLSDTSLLTSPTTTAEDRLVATKLSIIAKLDLKKYGMEMLKAASSIEGMSTKEIVNNDLKSYSVGNKKLAIGQIITLDFDSINKNIDDYINILNEMCESKYDMVVVFVTDIVKNGSYILYNEKSKDLIMESFGLKDTFEGVFVSGIVSRKKQVLPAILSILEGD